MKANRSIPSAVVIPVLIYPDVRAAVAWLSEAFGFVERVQIGEDHRSQLSVGDGAVLGARGVAFADLAPWTVYVGNPALEIRKRRRPS